MTFNGVNVFELASHYPIFEVIVADNFLSSQFVVDSEGNNRGVVMFMDRKKQRHSIWFPLTELPVTIQKSDFGQLIRITNLCLN